MNHPNSPDYQPTTEEILEQLYGIDFREYVAEQEKCRRLSK